MLESTFKLLSKAFIYSDEISVQLYHPIAMIEHNGNKDLKNDQLLGSCITENDRLVHNRKDGI